MGYDDGMPDVTTRVIKWVRNVLRANDEADAYYPEIVPVSHGDRQSGAN